MCACTPIANDKKVSYFCIETEEIPNTRKHNLYTL